jgi:hypothetical protein
MFRRRNRKADLDLTACVRVTVSIDSRSYEMDFPLAKLLDMGSQRLISARNGEPRVGLDIIMVPDDGGPTVVRTR